MAIVVSSKNGRAANNTRQTSLLDQYATVLVFLLVLVVLVMMRMDDGIIHYKSKLLSLQATSAVQRGLSAATTTTTASWGDAMSTTLGKMHNENKKKECDIMMGTKMDDSFFVCEPHQSDSTNPQQQSQNQSQIKCQWNPLLRTSFCEAHNLIVDPTKISVSNGGEDVSRVQGRDETEEFPTVFSNQ